MFVLVLINIQRDGEVTSNHESQHVNTDLGDSFGERANFSSSNKNEGSILCLEIEFS